MTWLNSSEYHLPSYSTFSSLLMSAYSNTPPPTTPPPPTHIAAVACHPRSPHPRRGGRRRAVRAAFRGGTPAGAAQRRLARPYGIQHMKYILVGVLKWVRGSCFEKRPSLLRLTKY